MKTSFESAMSEWLKGDEQYEVCPGCGCDPNDEHDEHCEVWLEKMREKAEMQLDLAGDR